MKVTYHAIYLIIAAMLSTTLFVVLEAFGVSPNPFLVYIVFAGFYISKNEAIWIGLIFGLIYDIIIGVNLGLNGILYMFASFLVVLSCENLISRNNALVTAVFVAVWTIILEGISAVFTGSGGALNAIKIIGIEMIYNGLLGCLLYLILNKTYEKLYDNDR